MQIHEVYTDIHSFNSIHWIKKIQLWSCDLSLASQTDHCFHKIRYLCGVTETIDKQPLLWKLGRSCWCRFYVWVCTFFFQQWDRVHVAWSIGGHSVQRRRLPASELCVFLEHDENTECAVSNSDTFVFCSSNKKFEMVLIFAVKISIGWKIFFLTFEPSPSINTPKTSQPYP